MMNSAKITTLYERLSRAFEQQGESNSITNQKEVSVGFDAYVKGIIS